MMFVRHHTRSLGCSYDNKEIEIAWQAENNPFFWKENEKD